MSKLEQVLIIEPATELLFKGISINIAGADQTGKQF